MLNAVALGAVLDVARRHWNPVQGYAEAYVGCDTAT